MILIRRPFSAIAWCVLCASFTTGRASVCDDPGDEQYIAAGLVDHGTSVIESELGETSQQNQNLQVLLVSNTNRLHFGFSHHYTKFNFESIEPQTNAHLHTSSFPVHWYIGGRRDVRLAVAPQLSASSNVLGHPRKYRSDTARLALALVWQNRLTSKLRTWYGVCGDYRFGGYALYPTAGLAWQPRPDWTVELGFPSSRVGYDVTERISTGLGIAPDGNEWHVMDRDFARESRFVYESYALEWVVDLQIGSRFSLAAAVGRQFRNRYEMTLLNGDRVDLASEPVTRTGAEVRWRF